MANIFKTLISNISYTDDVNAWEGGNIDYTTRIVQNDFFNEPLKDWRRVRIKITSIADKMLF